MVGSVATGVEVPSVAPPEVDLQEVQRQLGSELTRFKDELTAADDPILAENIYTVTENRLQVKYHDLSKIEPFPGWEDLSPERQLQAAYGKANSAAHERAEKGLKKFIIEGGRIRVEHEGGSMPSTATDLNVALQGLAEQHQWLLDKRMASAAVGVQVPTLQK